MSAFISCETSASSQILEEFKTHSNLPPFTITERFASEFLQLSNIYLSMRTKDKWRQAFLLQYYHANLNLFADFLQRFTTNYVEGRKQDFDPRSSKLQKWRLQEITTDSYHYQQFLGIGNKITARLESLLDIVKALVKDQTMPELFTLEPELRGCCKDIKGHLSRLSDDLEHHLRFLDLARNVSQTTNVQQLTLLATVFLPMSLAAGVLSMQSRFKDLGSLLYDFFGVVVLLAAIVMLLLVILSLLAYAKEQESRIEHNMVYRNLVRPILSTIVILGFLIFGGLVLSSFIVGMFKDVVLGARILGYGTTVAVGVPVVITALVWGYELISDLLESVLCSICEKKASWQRQKLEDPEADPSQKNRAKEPTHDNCNNRAGNNNLGTGVRGEEIRGEEICGNNAEQA
jgi:hypothetical protein